MSLHIKKMDSFEDVRPIVDFHMSIFLDNFTGEIGRKFLLYYFKRILASSNGVIYVCKDDNDIVGFISGLSSIKGFQDLNFYFYASVVTFWQIIVRPSIFVLILRHIKRMIVCSDIDCNAELLSLAIDGDYRRKGIARDLVCELEKFFQDKGVSEYEIFTDMVKGKGYLFYEKIGCNLIRKVTFFGLTAHLYINKVDIKKFN